MVFDHFSLMLFATFLFFTMFVHQTVAQLHFASLGNWGSGSSSQYASGKTLSAQAAKQPITYILSPGTNFIGGVTSLNDSKWKSAFSQPYLHENLKVPFLSVLGIDDWNANYTAQFLRTNATYNTTSAEELKAEAFPVWSLPNAWYHVIQHFRDTTGTSVTFGSARASVIFIMIDTYILGESFPLQNVTELHWNALRETLVTAASLVDWVIVVGDKAILSSGASKGDNYLARTLRQILRDANVDAYISGSDYDMEVIEDGSLLHINCGTASSTDPVPRVPMDNSVFYSTRTGYCFHTLTKHEFKTEFVDGHTGEVLYTYNKRINNRPQSYLDRYNKYQKLPANVYVPIQIGMTLVVNDRDLFVRICGTIGLIVVFYFGIMMTAVLCSRLKKAI